MNKDQLIEYMYINYGLSKVEAEIVVNGFTSAFEDIISSGENLDIEGIGKFQVSNLEINSHRLSKTIKRKIVSFSPSDKLLEDVA